MLNYGRSGRGPTLVMQHGYIGGHTIWTPQIPFFSRFFDVIIPDLPGHAGSAHVPPCETIECMAEAVLELLDDLSVDRFHLLGHSMGGMVVQAMAAQAGERIEKLVLYGTACSGAMPKRFEPFSETAKTMERDGIEATGRRIGATWFRQGEKAPLYMMCQNSGIGTTLETALAGLRAMPAWDGTDALAGFDMPTLVMGGDGDRSYSLEEMTHLARSIPDARLAIMPGCAHNAHLEKPDMFNQILADFLLTRDD